MKKNRAKVRARHKLIGFGLVITAILAGLLLFKLGSLTDGIAAAELKTANTPLGWHGIYHHPWFMPLNVLRSAVFLIFGHSNAWLIRLPNVPFGALAILAFVSLIWLWHGRRTALLTGSMFAASAWTLHISRIGTYDVIYLLAIPLLLITHVLMQRDDTNPIILYITLFFWSLLAFVPGLIWLLIFEVIWQRRVLQEGWSHFDRLWERGVMLLISIWWVPLVALNARQITQLKLWLGLPASFDSPLHLLKSFAAVFVHLFVRGPDYPHLWLGKAPLLDIFTLACAIIGSYFYLTHLEAQRSRLLVVLFLISVVLVGLGGPVSLSLIVPLAYIAAAAGIAYLIRAWLKIFPYNPLARAMGISLITVAVALSCFYNLKSYFVAWPHNPTTSVVFRYHP